MTRIATGDPASGVELVETAVSEMGFFLTRVQELEAEVTMLTAERNGLRAELARVDGHRRKLDRETANLTADVSRLTTVREALEVALTCTGSWGLGGDPSLCRECAEKVRAALAALDRLAESNWGERP